MGKDDGLLVVKAFRQTVDRRYQTDLVMNGGITALVILLPVLMTIILAIFILGGNVKYAVLQSQSHWVAGMMLLECFIIMAIIYKMYDRLGDHSRRDVKWREVLIRYAKGNGCDIDGLLRIDQEIRCKEKFRGKIPSFILLAAMFVFISYCFLFYLPNLEMVGNEPFKPVISGIVLVFMLFFVVFIRVLSFPYRHESMQYEFTIELAAQLNKVGITIPPMVPIIKHRSLLRHIALLIVTLGLYLFYLLYAVFRTMNNHLMNQWMYENQLLKVIESDGKEKFKYEIYAKLSKTDPHSKEVIEKYSREMRRIAREENRMPRILIIAELFLVFVCASYMLKMIAINLEIVVQGLEPEFTLDYLRALPTSIQYDYIIFVISLFLLMFTIDSLLGIASKRPSSWRKVCRSCITFVIPLWLSALVTKVSGVSHLFDFNALVTTGLLYDIIILMLVSQTIKEFYVPRGSKVPRLFVWCRYILYGDLKERKDIETYSDLSMEDQIFERTIPILDRSPIYSKCPLIITVALALAILAMILNAFGIYNTEDADENLLAILGIFVPLTAVIAARVAVKCRDGPAGVGLGAMALLTVPVLASNVLDFPYAYIFSKINADLGPIILVITTLILITVFVGIRSILRENRLMYRITWSTAIILSIFCMIGPCMQIAEMTLDGIVIFEDYSLLVYPMTAAFYLVITVALIIASPAKVILRGTDETNGMTVNLMHSSKSKLLRAIAVCMMGGSFCMLASLVIGMAGTDWVLDSLDCGMVRYGIPALFTFLFGLIAWFSDARYGPATDAAKYAPLMMLGLSLFSVTACFFEFLGGGYHPVGYQIYTVNVFNYQIQELAVLSDYRVYALSVTVLTLISILGLYHVKAKGLFRIPAVVSLIWISVLPTAISGISSIVSPSLEAILWYISFLLFAIASIMLAQLICNYCEYRLLRTERETEILRLMNNAEKAVSDDDSLHTLVVFSPPAPAKFKKDIFDHFEIVIDNKVEKMDPDSVRRFVIPEGKYHFVFRQIGSHKSLKISHIIYLDADRKLSFAIDKGRLTMDID